ncbi:hypothetical protein BD311DRAFT_736848 [Dichomitus squalens]|uniref:Uncharacterized protein n=1 Tax=Dichomitus squalens TaxID=114155 RepID=A0A4V2K1D1_9APHY|nr:hypothetical protein BD311DRAFT_736848 [Dichomitus squalens]
MNHSLHLILPLRYSWGEEEHNARPSLEVFVRTHASHWPAVASDTVATKIVLRGPWRISSSTSEPPESWGCILGGANGLGRWLPLVWSAPSAYEDDGDCFPFSTSELWGKPWLVPLRWEGITGVPGVANAPRVYPSKAKAGELPQYCSHYKIPVGDSQLGDSGITQNE